MDTLSDEWQSQAGDRDAEDRAVDHTALLGHRQMPRGLVSGNATIAACRVPRRD